MSLTSFSLHAATIGSASVLSTAMGFAQRTWTPARAAGTT